MPIATDLVLHEEPDPETARTNGAALGRVIERAARRWGSPLAIPLMDLRLEKIDLLARIGIAESQAQKFHFPSPLADSTLAGLCAEDDGMLCAGSLARDEALTCIASQTDLLPIGMSIGPFSLMTRLLADPISAVAMAGSGITTDDSVTLALQCLQAAEAAVQRSMRGQVEHGARAIMICEPAACTAFLSPRQIRAGSPVFEHFVLQPNLRLKQFLDDSGCDLIFHNCGELIDLMLQAFAERLHPVILSLGSSRKLWEDARLVPKDVVLYGNLPTKSFYSDSAMPLEEVMRRTEDLIAKMRACGHPHIVGSECDVLFVPEAADAIRAKVDAMMQVAAPA